MADASARTKSDSSWQAMADASARMPAPLQAGVEALSGIAMDDVRVHYNSTKPAQLQALAYTQGTDIHVGPGQERHLAHEAWHVVQQKQGRVQPTIQPAGVAVNADHRLEREADQMGARAQVWTGAKSPVHAPASVRPTTAAGVIQLKGPEPYNIFVAVLADMRDRDDENAAVSKIRAAITQWDQAQKYAFLRYLPEKYHRLALVAGMDLLADRDPSVDYEKGLLKTGGSLRSPRMEARKPFYQWLVEGSDTEPNAMNCWETVLFAAYKIGKYSKDDISNMIDRYGGATKLARDVIASPDGSIVKMTLAEGGVPWAEPSNGKFFIQDDELDDVSIPMGKVIVFGRQGQHVALSAGGTNIYENDSDPGDLVRSTIQAALGRNRREYGVALYWGELPG